MLPATPEHVARHQVPALRRDLEPAQGQRFIALDAAPVQQDLPEQSLGRPRPPGRHQDRLGRAHRRIVEHLQLLDVEHFFTAQ
jgi:hypothetical protein